jgi:hypothetical protein
MSRQARHDPQWSRSGASGSSSSVVKIAPRKNQFPRSRPRRFVCFPCQPSPAACPERLLRHRRGVHEDLHRASRLGHHPARHPLQPLLDEVVVVPPPRIDRNRPPVRPPQHLHRILHRAYRARPASRPTAPPARARQGSPAIPPARPASPSARAARPRRRRRAAPPPRAPRPAASRPPARSPRPPPAPRSAP